MKGTYRGVFVNSSIPDTMIVIETTGSDLNSAASSCQTRLKSVVGNNSDKWELSVIGNVDHIGLAVSQAA